MRKKVLSSAGAAIVAGACLVIGLGVGLAIGLATAVGPDPLGTVRAALVGAAPPGAPPPPPIPRADMVWPEITAPVAARCVPASRPIATAFGNNHDALYLPGTPGSPYPHYLLIPNTVGVAQLYGARTLSAEPEAWTLLVPDYHVTEQYELDDGIVIGDTYYIFEAHVIHAYRGDLALGSGQWEAVARFPEIVDDVAVHFDGETVHLFGEYGTFAGRPDGVSIAHMTAPPDFAEWTMVDPEIAAPNPGDRKIWGVGDASVIELNGQILMTTDIEAEGQPYRIALWRSPAFGETFGYAGIIAEPDPGTDGFRNYRVQDGDMVVAGDGSVIMFANWRDIDGDPGRALPRALANGTTRVIGGYTCRFE